MQGGEITTAQLAHELRETVGRFVRRLRAEPGPPFAQLAVLARLDREGAASIGDLAAADRMRPQSMAQRVRELEEAGLVSRRPDPQDRRRSLVEPTSAGMAMLQATRGQRQDWLTHQLDRALDAEQRELLRQAMALLSRLADP